MLADQVAPGPAAGGGAAPAPEPAGDQAAWRATASTAGTWRRAYSGLADRVGPGKLMEEHLIEWDAPDPNTLASSPTSSRSGTRTPTPPSTPSTCARGSSGRTARRSPPTTSVLLGGHGGRGGHHPGAQLSRHADRVNNEWVTATLNVDRQVHLQGQVRRAQPAAADRDRQDGGRGPQQHHLAGPLALPEAVPPQVRQRGRIEPASGRQEAARLAGPVGHGRRHGGPGRLLVHQHRTCRCSTPGKTTVPAPGDPHVMERNPYYWQVDTDGNQLPYVDRVEHSLFENTRSAQPVGRAGQDRHAEPPHQRRQRTPSTRRTRARAATGCCTGARPAPSAYFPNINCPDPVLAQMFADAGEFREALNVAINRKEINEVVWNGLRQAAPVLAGDRLAGVRRRVRDEVGASTIPNKANALLDGARAGEGRGRHPARCRTASRSS